MRIRHRIAVAACVAGALATGATAQNADEKIAAIIAATEKYRDVAVALADGYIPDPSGHCISAAAEGLPAEWGAMGVHYLNMAKLGITAGEPRVDGQGLNTDFLAPAILMYEPQADGSMELIGVENLVFQAAWLGAGNSGPPTFAGHDWDTMADDAATAGDEAHGFMPHFDQHIWAFRDNPAGALVPFNPNVTCEHHKG